MKFFKLDLGDKESILEFAKKVKKETDKIDFLLNNAGVMAAQERRLTDKRWFRNANGHQSFRPLLHDQLTLESFKKVIKI